MIRKSARSPCHNAQEALVTMPKKPLSQCPRSPCHNALARPGTTTTTTTTYYLLLSRLGPCHNLLAFTSHLPTRDFRSESLIAVACIAEIAISMLQELRLQADVPDNPGARVVGARVMQAHVLFQPDHTHAPSCLVSGDGLWRCSVLQRATFLIQVGNLTLIRKPNPN